MKKDYLPLIVWLLVAVVCLITGTALLVNPNGLRSLLPDDGGKWLNRTLTQEAALILLVVGTFTAAFVITNAAGHLRKR